MSHSDDGLVLPPRIAPQHRDSAHLQEGQDRRQSARTRKRRAGALLRQGDHALLDDRDLRGGEKTREHIKGVPIRLEVGPRDVESDAVFMGRQTSRRGKGVVAVVDSVTDILDEIQNIPFSARSPAAAVNSVYVSRR